MAHQADASAPALSEKFNSATENEQFLVCPDCKGAKELPAIASYRLADDTLGSEIRSIVCITCRGSGEITTEQAERIVEGKKLREHRVSQRKSLLEAATERGISPAELSAIEHGRATSNGERVSGMSDSADCLNINTSLSLTQGSGEE